MRVFRQALTAIVLIGTTATCVDQPTAPRIKSPSAPALTSLVNSSSRIAFESNRSGNLDIYTINADGTGMLRLTDTPHGDALPRWSPDGSRIAFTSFRDGNFEIYVMNADGSAQTRLTNSLKTDSDPSWSPDGSQIAFRSERDGNPEIYVMNADGSGQTRLTDNPAVDANPAWGTDGRIAFHSNRDGDLDIYVMNADGTDVTRLTSTPAVDAKPAWSPDGRRIAFTSDRDGQAEVYVMNADGSGQLRVSHTDYGSNSDAHWSPDGEQLVFTTLSLGETDLLVMNADGSGLIHITAGGFSDNDPDWAPATLPSPRGQLLFSTDRDGHPEIYIMNADGSNPVAIPTQAAFSKGDGAWSRDGQKIAFTSSTAGGGIADIYTMNSDGSGVTQLTDGHTSTPGTFALSLNPSWSPDGTQIAFVSTRGNGSPEIYVMNADGSHQQQLTSAAIPDIEINRRPSWSPDGRKIVYRSAQTGTFQIFVMNPDGSNQTNLSNNRSFDNHPEWSPDGSKIAFTSSRDGNSEVYVMNADGSEQKRITFEPNTDTWPTWSPDGRYIAFASNRAAHSPGDVRYDIYVVRSDGSGPSLRVTNTGSNADAAWRPIFVAPPSNQAPIANAGSDISTFRSNSTTASVSLDGSKSSDPDGDALEFTWFESSSQIATGPNPTVDLPLGVHNIELRVSDGRGGQAGDGVVVTVSNRAPVVTASDLYTGFEGVDLSYSASAVDADGDPLSFTWDLGDGTTGRGPALPAAHTYVDNGTYNALFAADDGNGGADRKSATVSIANLAPSVRVGTDATIVSGGLFNFSGAFSDRGVNDAPWNWSVSWGEGAPSTGTTSNQAAAIEGQHRYLRAGIYRVELSVTDKDRDVGTGSIILTVGRQIVGLNAFPFPTSGTPSVLYNLQRPSLSEPVIIAVLGTSDFAPVDPVTKRSAINLASVRLGSVPVATLPAAIPGALNGLYVAGPADVNRDGRLDLLLTFQTDKLVLAGNLNPAVTTPQSLTLVGDHNDGRQFTGSQQLKVVTVRGN